LLEDLRPQRCQERYTAMTKVTAVDTHRNAVAAAKMFGRWCMERGWLRESRSNG
jgi:hypothetical protein